MSMMHTNIPLVNKSIHISFVKPICFATQNGVATHSLRSPGLQDVHIFNQNSIPAVKCLVRNLWCLGVFRFAILSHQLHQWLVIWNNVGCTAVATVCIFHQTSIPSCIGMRSSQYVVNLVVLKLSNIITKCTSVW